MLLCVVLTDLVRSFRFHPIRDCPAASKTIVRPGGRLHATLTTPPRMAPKKKKAPPPPQPQDEEAASGFVTKLYEMVQQADSDIIDVSGERIGPKKSEQNRVGEIRLTPTTGNAGVIMSSRVLDRTSHLSSACGPVWRNKRRCSSAPSFAPSMTLPKNIGPTKNYCIGPQLCLAPRRLSAATNSRAHPVCIRFADTLPLLPPPLIIVPVCPPPALPLPHAPAPSRPACSGSPPATRSASTLSPASSPRPCPTSSGTVASSR